MSGGGRKFDHLLKAAKPRKFDHLLQKPSQEQWDANIASAAGTLASEDKQIASTPQQVADRSFMAAESAAQDPLDELAGEVSLPSRAPQLRQHTPSLEAGPLDTLLEKSDDIVKAGQQSALMNWGDELSADPEGLRRDLEIGRKRTPTGTAVADTAGALFTAGALATNPAGAALQGGLSSGGEADDGQRMAAILRGSTVGGLTGLAGKAVSGTGNVLRGKPIQKFADEMTTPVQGWMPKLGEVASAAWNALRHNPLGLATGATTYVGRRIPALQKPVAAAAQKVAKPIDRVLDYPGQFFPRSPETGFAAGLLSSQAGERIGHDYYNDEAMDELADAPQQSTASGRGNLLPSAALDAVHAGGDELGKWKSQFFEAASSPDQGAVSALITKLSESDPEFRASVLPRLRAKTGGE